MTDTTIVTAFFDIKRGEWTSSNMSSNTYLNHFASWARLQNDLIVYTDTETAKEVVRIRSEFGLYEKTTVIEIDDCRILDQELFESIDRAMSAPHARQFHLKPNNPESWNSVYNYVMLMKWWCVCDAIKRGIVLDNVAWLDFGFNKSGAYYSNPEEFDFYWNPDIEKKIYMFSINDLDDIPVYEIIQRMDTYIQGCSIIGPKELWPIFWRLIRESMIELNHCGLCDDDQVLMLMSYRKQPELFKIIKCPWNGGIEATGVDSLTIKKNTQSISSLKNKYRSLRSKFIYLRRVNTYCKKQNKLLLKRNTIND